jgi:hypothetical protein
MGTAEPVFVNVYGARESIPPEGRYDKYGCRTGPPGWDRFLGSLTGLQIRALYSLAETP